MSELYYGYVPFPQENDTISIEHWKSYQVIPRRTGDSYPLHRHHFYELVMINSGLCLHTYKNTTISLIPGDMFLIPPDEDHAYKFHDGLSIFNCQFFPLDFPQRILDILDELNFISLSGRTNQILSEQHAIFDSEQPGKNHSAFLNEQGILHLNASQRFYIETLLTRMRTEQQQRQEGYSYILHNYLEILLYELARIKKSQYTISEKINSKKERMIMDTLNYIDAHLSEPIDFAQIAESYQLSHNYFRTIFREITGISPIEYLNRTRILKSLEYLRLTDMAIIDVAATVGIYDANYFTRMFKKYMDYPPKYFKNIQE